MEHDDERGGRGPIDDRRRSNDEHEDRRTKDEMRETPDAGREMKQAWAEVFGEREKGLRSVWC